MDKFIFQAFQNLPNKEVSASLHTSIIRAAIFRRSWKYFSVLTFISLLTFLFSIWHLYTRIIEMEAISAIKAVISTFELNMASIMDSAETLFEFLPTQAIALSFLNFITLIFMVFLLRSFKRLSGEFAA